MLDDKTSESIHKFALDYDGQQRVAIRFAWNGKHADEFRDENQELRWSLAKLVLAEPDSVPLVLVRDLLMEDSAWSHEAWCAPHHFAGLLSILLLRGGREYLFDFAAAMNATFDTFGAAHEVAISSEKAHDFLREADAHLLVETDPRRRSELDGAKELFQKMIDGNAANGWVKIPPGTPVRNIRIVDSVPQSAKAERSLREALRTLPGRLRRLFLRWGR
ncbi:hypothetical protein [uncultured Paludibaculum sp.]|uniref:hypothetical protein n=1 Tax=uncultured Paludibaculum sp. TaxID=1765020 RepID=UPI002AAC0E48|nr:hypothetical protein [uncultured Paludibaculum sp.]